MDKEKSYSPVRLELLITIVDKGKGTFFSDFVQDYDVNMGLVIAGEGTAATKMLEYLGLSENRRSVVFSIVREDRLKELLPVLEEKLRAFKGGNGVSVAVPLSSVIGTSIFGFLSNDKRGLKEDTQTTGGEV